MLLWCIFYLIITILFNFSIISLFSFLQKVAPDTAEAINAFLKKLRSFAAGDASFTFILDDPAGNSFIENP